MSVSKGSIKAIVEKNEKPSKLILQVLHITAQKENGHPTRRKMVVTDGEMIHNVFLQMHLSPLVEMGSIKQFSIISVSDYQVTIGKDDNSTTIIVIKTVKLVSHNDRPIEGVVLKPDNTVSFKPTASNNKRKNTPSTPEKPKNQVFPSKDNITSKIVSKEIVRETFTPYTPPSPVMSPLSESDEEDLMSDMESVKLSEKPQSSVSNSSSLWGNSNKAMTVAKPSTAPPTAAPVSSSDVNNKTKPSYRASSSLVPIAALTPSSKNWMVLGRVTNKSELKEWNNQNGSGTVFSVDLLDRDQNEIKATFYKDAATKFFSVLEPGKVYSFAAGSVRNVDKKSFTRLTNQFELVFHTSSVIRAESDDQGIKDQVLKMVKIRNLGDFSKDSLVDVAGVVRGYGEATVLNLLHTGDKQHTKRELTLVDDTNCEIRLTLWGEHANMRCDWSAKPILVLKGVKVVDYQGRGLSTTASTTVQLNPCIPEIESLVSVQEAVRKGDFRPEMSLTATGGGMIADLNSSQLLDRVEIKAFKGAEYLAVNLPDKGAFVSTKATVTHIKHTGEISYCACPTGGCGRKVTPVEETGGWACAKCNKEFSECRRRFVLYLTLSDHTGGQIVTVHNDVAEKLLGHSAQQLEDIKACDMSEYSRIMSDVTFLDLLCRIKVQKEVSADQERVKFTLIGMTAVDIKQECDQMDAALCCLMEAELRRE